VTDLQFLGYIAAGNVRKTLLIVEVDRFEDYLFFRRHN
jgi:hypothetical protein